MSDPLAQWIPNPICIARTLWRSLRHGFVISGHDFRELPPEAGQPACVTTFKCDTCGFYTSGWKDCPKCGAKP